MARLSALLLLTLSLFGCRAPDDGKEPDGRITVVATTNIVADLVASVGGDAVSVTSLMGPGVDPHLYKASEGDVRRMSGADAIFYGGLHLEGKMTEVFEQMQSRGIRTVAVADGNSASAYIESPDFGGNYDPHIWFDVSLWQGAARYVHETLAAMDSTRRATLDVNLSRYLGRLDSLDAYVRSRVEQIPAERRVVITSHDAFGYLGRAYGFEVRGLQGISTVLEAGAADVQDLADFVTERRIPALFVESSVPPRGIEAVREAVRARGFDVAIGGSLFSDALGGSGTPEATYLGMVRHNIDTLADALSASP
ncbi:MAG: zinc ABC transporter substrate-binding protein [Rhodothermales bacterium]|nr:zinc ABC transporter substrate-binding protein [Rhodothermales bacterium]